MIDPKATASMQLAGYLCGNAAPRLSPLIPPQNSNTGARKLVVRLPGKATAETISVAFEN
jgi:hypothetical protein